MEIIKTQFNAHCTRIISFVTFILVSTMVLSLLFKMQFLQEEVYFRLDTYTIFILEKLVILDYYKHVFFFFN